VVEKSLVETDSTREWKLLLGGLAGLAAAFVGAIAWAIVTVATKYQIGWMALGVGALVGLALRLGNGGKAFGILGACLALFGCVLGNFLSLVAFSATQQHISVFAVLANVDYAKASSVMWDNFLSTGILFYGIAVYEGYRFSVTRQKSVEQKEV
jgi:hypothetical protein